MKEYNIDYEISLGDFLKNNEKKWKNLLKYEKVAVNGVKVTNYHHILKKGDHVFLDTITKEIPKDLNIIYEDHEFIVIYKPSGLLRIATDKEKEKTLYHKVREYLHKKNEKVFVLHRLDKDTSGIVVFCKNEKLKVKMQKNWNNFVLKRFYVALIKGNVEKTGTLQNYIKEIGNKVVITTSKDEKKAITNYKVLKQNNKYSLIDIDLKTGRKNQIRVQFAHIGHPVIGDVKYGVKDDRLYLHAYEFSFMHPITKKIFDFKVDIPSSFEKRMKN